jgi:hypothetical protein
MIWAALTFGKHAEKTLPQVAFADPDWLFWAVEAGVFKGASVLGDDAERVYSRAKRVRIPQDTGEQLVAEYAFCQQDGRFANVEIVPASRRPHQGSSPTMRLPFFDLSVPRRFCAYDKAGGRTLVAALKVYLFGDPDYRMTRERSGRFFQNDANFVLPAASRESGGIWPPASASGAARH